jgi:8-amino-7-oxononanoate synthase
MTVTVPPRTTLDAVLADALAALGREARRRELHPWASRSPGLVHDATGRSFVDFASNDYLGLAADPRLAEAAQRFVAQHAPGAPASRLISGDHPAHHALEAALAALEETDAAILFGSGFLANTGTIPALVGRGDLIVADAANHASLIEACRLSRAEVVVTPHADIDAVAAVLQRDRHRVSRALVVTDGVFSMDADVAPLHALSAVARQYDAWTYVDDAHGHGVLAEGRGIVGLAGDDALPDVRMGTLGKAFGVGGGFVAGSSTLVDWLRNRARTFVFTTAMPPVVAAAALEGVRLATAEPWRRARVAAVGTRIRRACADAGIVTLGTVPHLVPIVIGDDARTVAIGRALRERGLLVGAIRPPTVPDGTARLRLSCSAAHTDAQIDHLLAELLPLLQ